HPKRLRRARDSLEISCCCPFSRPGWTAPSMQGKELSVTPPSSLRASMTSVGLLCLLLYVPPAALTPFFTKGEPREALVVRRMVEDGTWLLPKRASANGWTIASKPPFFHWLGAAASSIGGTATEWTV